MSSSTSPGSQTTSPPEPQAGMDLKETKADPVALIDARIQVGLIILWLAWLLSTITHSISCTAERSTLQKRRKKH